MLRRMLSLCSRHELLSLTLFNCHHGPWGTQTPENMTARSLYPGLGLCGFVCLVKIIENSLRSLAVAATTGSQRALGGVDSGLGLRASELDEEP